VFQHRRDEPVIVGREIEHGRGTCVEGSWGQDQEQYTMLFLVPFQDRGLEVKMLMRNSLHASPAPTKCVLCSLAVSEDQTCLWQI